MSANSALGLALLIKKGEANIEMILFDIFEIVSLVFSLLTYTRMNATKTFDKIEILIWAIQSVFYTFTTAIWLYWIDATIMNPSEHKSPLIKKLQTAFATCFVISLILKSIASLATLQIFSQSNIGCFKNTRDIESTACSTNDTLSDKEKMSIGSKIVKLKDSAQTLVSDNISIKNLKNDNRILDIQLAECINTGETYFVEDSSEMTTQQMLIYNLSMHNFPVESDKSNKPILNQTQGKTNSKSFNSPQIFSKYEFPHVDLGNETVSRNIHNDASDDETDHFYDDFVDSKKIRMLNISETPYQAIQSSPKLENDNYRMEKLATKFTQTKVSPFFELEPKVDINTVPINRSSSENVLLKELNREIRENDLHKLKHEESIKHLRSSSVKLVRGSFSRTLKNSISTSTLNMNYNKQKPNMHAKSSSLSALNIHKARLQSPLKKILNIKDQTDKQYNKDVSPETEFDMNLVNSIRSSPKKKVSARSLNSKAKNSLTRSSSIRNECIFGETEDPDSSMNPANSTQVLEESTESHAKKTFKENFNKMFGVKNNRNFSSSTDKSTTSSNSMPSGYYGQYDKEKWQAFKKFADVDVQMRIDLSNISHISTSTMPAILDTPINVLDQDLTEM